MPEARSIFGRLHCGLLCLIVVHCGSFWIIVCVYIVCIFFVTFLLFVPHF